MTRVLNYQTTKNNLGKMIPKFIQTKPNFKQEVVKVKLTQALY